MNLCTGTITVLGFLLLVVTFTFLGPAPYLPLPPSLELTLPSLVTQGAGSAAVIVSTYSSCLRATLNIPGYPRNATTNTVVSGLWTSVFALGNFVGPTLAGVMYEEVGGRADLSMDSLLLQSTINHSLDNILSII